MPALAPALVVPGAVVQLAATVVLDAHSTSAQTVLTNTVASNIVITAVVLRSPSATLTSSSSPTATLTVNSVAQTASSLVSGLTATGLVQIPVAQLSASLTPNTTATVTFSQASSAGVTVLCDVLGYIVQ